MKHLNSQSGFTHTAGLLILLILALVSGTGYYVYTTGERASLTTHKAASPSGVTNADDSENKPKTNAPTEVNTTGGATVYSPDRSYSINVPKGWFYIVCDHHQATNSSILGLASTQRLIDTCNHKNSSEVQFYTGNIKDTPTGKCGTRNNNPQTNSNLFTDISLNGAAGYRHESIDDSSSATPGMKHVYYSFCLNEKQYMANYSQYPDDPDNARTFDQIVQTWKF